MDGHRIRVLLADDHTMFRQGLAEMLSMEQSIEVVGDAENGNDVVTLAEETKPDVTILDVEMPGPGARETMRLLFGISPIPKVVVVTMFDNPRLVREMLAAGASAFLVKSASMQELLAAVHTAANNPHRDNVIVSVPRGILDQVERGEVDELTPRELEIVLLVARGLTNRQISDAIHISEATVKRHLANVYAKLDVSSRGETTKKALSEGWITTWDVTQDEERTD
jgi:DNA-binding NarL/FixJ family response regulator